MSLFNSVTSIYCRGIFLGMLCLAFTTSWAQAAEDYQLLRQRLVAEISQDVMDTRSYIGKSALDERVMQVLGSVGRHRFVPG